MVSVELTARGKRKTILVDENTTIASVLSDNGVDVRLTPPALNGSMLDAKEITQTFKELGIEDRCLLTCVVKTSNA